MAQEVTLNLKMIGMLDLIKSIRDLNKALDVVNNKFARTAQSINAAAQSISKVVGNAQATIGKGGGGGGRRGNKPGNASNPSLYDDVVLSKALFGGGNSKQYLAANLMDKFKNANIGKILSKFGLGNIAGSAGPASIRTLGALISKIALPLLILKVILDVVIEGFKLFVKAMEQVYQAVRSQAQLIFASGGNGGLVGRFRSAGYDPSQVAGMIRDPSQGRILENQLDILRHMDIQSASRFANFNGINPDIAMTEFFKSDAFRHFDKLQEQFQANGVTNGLGNKASADFMDAIGSVKNSLEQIWSTLAPVLEAFAVWLKGVAFGLQLFAKGLEFVIQGLFKIADTIAPFLHLEDSLKNLTNSVKSANSEIDKMTQKIGTFGGRERAQNALPSAWTYYAYQGNLTRLAGAMGAFQF